MGDWAIDLKQRCESVEHACSELMALSFGATTPRKGTKRHAIPLSRFQGLIPMHDRWSQLLLQGRELLFASDASDVYRGRRQPDVAAIVGYGSDERAMTFVRSRDVALSPTIAANIFHLPSVNRSLIEHSVCCIGADLKHDAYAEHLTYSTGRLMRVSRQLGRPELAHAETRRVVGFLPSIDLTMRYEWRVNIGPTGGASFAMVANRDALPELFRFREMTDGKSRRTALLHFVSSHWRRGRGQAPAEDPSIFVKNHMRGQTRFSWNGLSCEVVPPAFEVEKMEAACG